MYNLEHATDYDYLTMILVNNTNSIKYCEFLIHDCKYKGNQKKRIEMAISKLNGANNEILSFLTDKTIAEVKEKIINNDESVSYQSVLWFLMRMNDEQRATLENICPAIINGNFTIQEIDTP